MYNRFMENIKHLIINAYIVPLINFLMYWLMQTPLQFLNKAYLLFIAGTIGVVFTIVVIGVPLNAITLLFQSQFCPGENFKEKWNYRMEKRTTRKAIIQKEWPKGFLYRYLNQLSYMGVFVFGLGAVILKSVDFFWVSFNFLILIIIRNKKIKKKFNYELYANIDLLLCLIVGYISIFLIVHFLVNYNLR